MREGRLVVCSFVSNGLIIGNFIELCFVIEEQFMRN